MKDPKEPGSEPVVISSAVEGYVDRVVAHKLIRLAGGHPGPTFGEQGKDFLRKRIKGFNNSAQNRPWFVLFDLDRGEECPGEVVTHWLPDPAQYLCLRVAVRTIESWLMADRQAIATYLSVPISAVPAIPDQVLEPKSAMLDLARRSKSRQIRRDMLPTAKGGRKTGPAYNSRLMEFTLERWSPKRAEIRSESLRRAIACLNRLVSRAQERV